ncbi:MAG: M28 family peptidase [Longimicrobiales bacterium]
MKAKRSASWTLLALGASACASAQGSIPLTSAELELARDVAYLASPELEGRALGTAGGDRAAVFLADRYAQLGLRGAFSTDCTAATPCDSEFFQIFQVRGVRAENLVVAIPGADPLLRGRYVVLGAHYDHIGWSAGVGPDTARVLGLRRGADDNASGTAALLELGRRLSLDPPGVSVLLAHFDAEEAGLFGSRALVEDPPIPLDSVVLMINLDMIGRLESGSLLVEVTSPADGHRDLIERLAREHDLPFRFSRATAGRSDHSSFAAIDVPAIALFTGFHNDYHLPTDTPDKVDYAGIRRVVDLVESLSRAAAPTTLPR